MKKVQDTHLNIGGLNWPVLINTEQVCRVMVDLRNNIEFRITERSERKNAKCWNKRSSGWC